MQPNVLIGPGTKTYVPNLSSQLAFMSIGSLVRFGSVIFLLLLLLFFWDSSSLVKDPQFILFLNFYPRNQEVAS
jgi:hypothetical protein